MREQLRKHLLHFVSETVALRWSASERFIGI